MTGVVRAVLDANVYVSAVLRPQGPPGQLIERFLHAGFEIVLTPAIADEISRALTYPKVRKFMRRNADPALWLEDIALLADMLAGERPLPGICADPDDDKYIAAALEGRAAFLVTGDRDLLDLKQYEGVGIVTPREFLDFLKFEETTGLSE